MPGTVAARRRNRARVSPH